MKAYAYNRTPHMLKPEITHNRRVRLRFKQNCCTDFFNERTAIRKLKNALIFRFANNDKNVSLFLNSDKQKVFMACMPVVFLKTFLWQASKKIKLEVLIGPRAPEIFRRGSRGSEKFHTSSKFSIVNILCERSMPTHYRCVIKK